MDLNSFFARLPRTRFGVGSREIPAFKACGFAGYYLAVIATLAGGLLTSRSLLVLAALSAVCGVSFYAYAHARRRLSGAENLVLLEHVWFAEACVAGTLFLLGEPLLGYLDVVSVGLSLFLASGRIGCLLVGCCHGLPADVGIVYGESAGNDGFDADLVGVRLFPVQLVEAIGLVVIGLVGFSLLRFAPGTTFVWFTLAYAVMRFGLEELRGDSRPHFAGLSQARWMAVIDIGLGLAIQERGRSVSVATCILAGVVAGAGVLAWWVSARGDLSRKLLRGEHLNELVTQASGLLSLGPRSGPPRTEITSLGVSLAMSDGNASRVHVSICLPEGARDLPLLCLIAATGVPSLDPGSAVLSNGHVLHFTASRAASPWDGKPNHRLGRRVYGEVLRAQLGAKRDEGVQEAADAENERSRYFGAEGGAADDRLAS